MTQQESDFIEDFLQLDLNDKGFRSCLTMALKSARYHTGRNIRTGIDENGLAKDEIFDNDMVNAEYFIGLTSYLILLEQIGQLFIKVGYNRGNKKNGIIIALDNFSTLNYKEKNAIKSLRNSLAHNFGLATTENPYHQEGKKEQLYKFTLHFDKNTKAIIPNLKWNGDFNDKSESTNTIVGVEQLCNLVEDVYLKLIYEFKKNNLILRIENLNEIKARFTIE